MTKRKPKYYFIDETEVPLYGGYLSVISTNDKVKLKKQVGSFQMDTPYATAHIDFWDNAIRFVIVLNFWELKANITHGIIAHEAIHAVNFIAEQVGMQHDIVNDEPFAYLTEWIVDQVYKSIDKNGLAEKVKLQMLK